jgi:O-antigen ligase
MAHSSTSLGCVLIGMMTIVLVGRRIVSKRYIGTCVVTGIIVCVVAEMLFGLYAKGIEFLGRDPTLTDRTEVWNDALSLVDDPILGAGFESFWLGDRLEALWAKWWWQPTQAHNGYIETYLNLGLIGVFIFAALIIASFRKIRLELLRNFEFGRFRLAFLFAILVYNYTEATFKSVSIVWTLFHIIAMDYPRLEQTQSAQHPEPVAERENTEAFAASG